MKENTNIIQFNKDSGYEKVYPIITNGLTGLTDKLMSKDFAPISAISPLIYNSRMSFITLQRPLLASMYLENGLLQVLVDLPVEEAFRGEFRILCDDELDHKDITKLLTWFYSDEVLGKFKSSLKWSRLFGGAGLIINTPQSKTQEFSLDKVKQGGFLEFYDCDRWELNIINDSGNLLDEFSSVGKNNLFNYYGHVIDGSHVLLMNGVRPPSYLRGLFSGWGVSVGEAIVRSLNNYLKNQNVSYELVDEAKIDVYSISKYNTMLMSPKGEEQVLRHLNLVQETKNYQGAIVHDTTDGYDQKQISFSGLSDLARESRIQVASDIRIPVSKLFGISISNLNSSEEADIDNYINMVETTIRTPCKGLVNKILKIGCKHLFGFVPEMLDFEYPSLKQTTEKENIEIKAGKMNMIIGLQQAGIISSKTAVELVNREKLFSRDLDPEEAVELKDFAEETEDVDVGVLSRSTGGKYIRPY